MRPVACGVRCKLGHCSFVSNAISLREERQLRKEYLSTVYGEDIPVRRKQNVR